MSTSMKIIVNADDLGVSDAVNEAIFKGMRAGVITSATMLANGPALTDAARSLLSFPACSFGVHLNLTEFEPIRAESKEDLAPILDRKGCFNGNSIREVTISRKMMAAIFKEWCSQIESLMRLGVELSHLDAHHHVHTIPELLPVLAALGRRYKINKVRISRNMYDDRERPIRVLLAKKWLYNLALRTVGFHTTRIFTDLVTYVKLCAESPPRTTTAELMTHPGSKPGTEEANLLESYWPDRLTYKPMLISYKGL